MGIHRMYTLAGILATVCMYVSMYVWIYVCILASTCGVYISKELVRYVSHFTEDGQVTGPFDFQAIGPRPANEIVLALFMYVWMYACMYVYRLRDFSKICNGRPQCQARACQSLYHLVRPTEPNAPETRVDILNINSYIHTYIHTWCTVNLIFRNAWYIFISVYMYVCVVGATLPPASRRYCMARQHFWRPAFSPPRPSPGCRASTPANGLPFLRVIVCM